MEKHQNDHKTHGSGETIVYTSCKLFWYKRKYSLHISLGKINNVATIDLVIGHNKFDPFCQKSERYYDESMDNPVVAKFATIGDDDNYIDKQTSKQT